MTQHRQILVFRLLPQEAADISSTVNDSDNLQRLRVRAIDDPSTIPHIEAEAEAKKHNHQPDQPRNH